MSCTIYMYHRIVPRQNAVAAGYRRAGMTLEVDEFALHLKSLSETSVVLGIDELASGLSNGQSMTKRRCALTFDDGFLEHYRWVMPILDDFGFTATFFVNGNCWPHLRRPRWLDVFYAISESATRERWISYFAKIGTPVDPAPQAIDVGIDALKMTFRGMDSTTRDGAVEDLAERLDVVVTERSLCSNLYLDVAMLKEMHGAGMTIGAHTLTHPDLSKIPLEDAKREILGSVELVSELTGEEAVPFAYPFGGPRSYNSEVVGLVMDSGCSCACTSGGGENTSTTPRFELRRVNVSSSSAIGK